MIRLACRHVVGLLIANASIAVAAAQSSQPTTVTPGLTTSAPAPKVTEAVLKPETPAGEVGWLRITGNVVNIRSRPDVNGLSMARLDRDKIVWGVKKLDGWYAIEPPPEVFSLVAAEFVKRTADDRGLVEMKAGETLRVRAGSAAAQIDPMKTDVQARLANGSELRIVGETTDPQKVLWFQIVPPEGVLAFISAEFVEPISDEAARGLGAVRRKDAPPVAVKTTDVALAQDVSSKPPIGSWTQRLRLLATEIEAESKKPSQSQSWAKLLSDLKPIAEQRDDAIVAGEAARWLAKVEEILSTAVATADAPAPSTAPAEPAVTTTIIPVTPAPGTVETPVNPASQPAAPSVPMEPSPTLGSEVPAYDVEGVLQPSWRIPAGQFGLRYKLCNPTNPNYVRGYAEFPFELGASATQHIGKYVGVNGDRYIDTEYEVPIFRARRLTVLDPARPVNRPRD
ncbi:MAG: hypothetical protein HZB38_01250 [Planctomycetes bacterium]|nr:hypothetical protein [Planctomycetota bacterium]